MSSAPSSPRLAEMLFAAGRRNSTVNAFSNGCFTYFSYDALGRAASIQNCLPDGSPLVYFAYDYDPAGRITKCGREDASVVYYGYDDADRLASFTWKDAGGSTLYAFAWDYDAVGNRLHEDRNGVHNYYEYDAGNELIRYRQLPADTWTYFEYDPHGRGNCSLIHRPAAGGATYFAYNDADLVTEIRYPGGAVNYFYYDALMRRYAIRDSAGLAYFTYDRDGLCPLTERDADGNVVARYTRGHARIPGIGDLAGAQVSAGGATYYQFDVFDPVGNLLRTVDENGTVTGSFEYDPWGAKLRNDAPPEGTRFGQSAPAWLDIPNGDLALSRRRIYHKLSGRFLQRDPKRGVRGEYTYCRENPLAYVDPDGAEPTYLIGRATYSSSALYERTEEYKRALEQSQGRITFETFWGHDVTENQRELIERVIRRERIEPEEDLVLRTVQVKADGSFDRVGTGGPKDFKILAKFIGKGDAIAQNVNEVTSKWGIEGEAKWTTLIREGSNLLEIYTFVMGKPSGGCGHQFCPRWHLDVKLTNSNPQPAKVSVSWRLESQINASRPGAYGRGGTADVSFTPSPQLRGGAGADKVMAMVGIGTPQKPQTTYDRDTWPKSSGPDAYTPPASVRLRGGETLILGRLFICPGNWIDSLQGRETTARTAVRLRAVRGE